SRLSPSSSARSSAAGSRPSHTFPYDRAMLRVISYLAPSIPVELFALVARHVAERREIPTVAFHTFRRRRCGRGSHMVPGVYLERPGRSLSCCTVDDITSALPPRPAARHRRRGGRAPRDRTAWWPDWADIRD